MECAVCFIGHRKTKETYELKKRLECVLSELIQSGTVNFIFGDQSDFNSLCYKTVTQLKEKHPEIRRIHFRKDYEGANEYTKGLLIAGYEESICPKGVGKAGRAGYVERNTAMIDQSDICIFYYNEKYTPDRRKLSRCDVNSYQPKSGTEIAYKYALKKGKRIYNLFAEEI